MSQRERRMIWMTRLAMLIISAIFVVFSITTNIALRDDINKKVNNQLIKDTVIVSNRVEQFFTRYTEIVRWMTMEEALVRVIRESATDKAFLEHPLYDEALLKLIDVKDSSDQIISTYIGINGINNFLTNDNLVNTFTPEEYTYSERSWYKEMIQADLPVIISALYESVIYKDQVSIVAPIYPSDDIHGPIEDNIGQVALNLSLQTLTDYIETYRVGDEGFAVLLDGFNGIIAPEMYKDQVADFLQSKATIDDIENKMALGQTEATTIQLDGHEYYFSFTPIAMNKWYVATFIPSQEIMSELIYFNMVSVIILLALIMIGIAFFNFRKLNIKYKELQAANQRLEEQDSYIKRLAYIDPLTEIPNRRSFVKKVRQALKTNKPGAVLMLDLDNFKEINDTMGHITGDVLLKDIGKFLAKMTNDRVYVSRFGGDEFLILLENRKSFAEVETLAEHLIGEFALHIRNKGHEMYVGMSIGISVYPEDSMDLNNLIMYADTAMYQVKNMGKNNYMRFNQDMAEQIQDKLDLEKIQRHSIENDGFKVLYQPQILLENEKVAGLEALLRLKNVAVPANVFIELAEEKGLIIPIGRIVIEKVFAFINDCHMTGYDCPPVAINFSPKQINDYGFSDFLKNQMNKYQISSDDFHIEITESILIEDERTAMNMMNELRKMGVKIALDDFGTGYSSISYLTYMHVDYLKLDKSLCDQFLGINDVKTISSIIGLGHSLNIRIIAEGIETRDQVEELKKVGCDMVQGYFYSKPLEAQAFREKYE